MFFFPLFIYLFIGNSSEFFFVLSPFECVLILIQGAFFAYLGNVFSLKGIEYSPNPGYSLIISKSYVVFTSVASIFIFSSPLTMTSFIAILLIIFFSALIMIDTKKTRTHANKLWLPYTFGAFFCWGLLALTSKYLLDVGVPVLTRLMYSMVIVSFLTFIEIKVKKIRVFPLTKTNYVVLLMIGLFSTSFNYYMQVGFNLVPNVGYVNAVNAASMSLLTLLSALFFKDDLSLKKMIGIVGVTVGLFILFL